MKTLLIITLSLITLSLSSCFGMHTYKMSRVNPFGGKERLRITVVDFGDYKIGQVVEEGRAYWTVEEKIN